MDPIRRSFALPRNPPQTYTLKAPKSTSTYDDSITNTHMQIQAAEGITNMCHKRTDFCASGRRAAAAPDSPRFPRGTDVGCTQTQRRCPKFGPHSDYCALQYTFR